MTDILTLTMPDNIYMGYSASPSNLTLAGSFEAGRYLSFFSGSYISDTSASHLDDVGVSESYTYINPSLTFKLTMNNTNLLSSGSDTSYEIMVYQYWGGIPLNYYSASTLSAMANNSLTYLSIFGKVSV